MQVSNNSVQGISVGSNHPAYIIAEIGINHNGDLDTAKKLIDVAAVSGCQAVKFQKRTPEISTPESQKLVPRETPWGTMTYLDYKNKLEFGVEEYLELAKYSAAKRLDWFASPWDVPSVEFLENLGAPAHKIASASLTDLDLLEAVRQTSKPIIMSTGMSTMQEIDKAVEVIGTNNLIMMHATSSYPLAAEEVNLRMIETLRERYRVPVGYSGHEKGLQISIAAVAMGAVAIERHITLDRAMWGSDHAASLEPTGLTRLVRDIRVVEAAMGDGIKRVYASEQNALDRLRKK